MSSHPIFRSPTHIRKLFTRQWHNLAHHNSWDSQLHFSVNLVSLSALIDQINCRIIMDKVVCSIQERSMGKSLGTAARRRGLWYMDRSKTDREGMHMLAAVADDKETRALIHHCSMGHLSFDKMYQVFVDVMSGVDKSKLNCDACEFAKHTRSSYVSKEIMSISSSVLIHYDVWTCLVLSTSGMQYSVTFIDSRDIKIRCSGVQKLFMHLFRLNLM